MSWEILYVCFRPVFMRDGSSISPTDAVASGGRSVGSSAFACHISSSCYFDSKRGMEWKRKSIGLEVLEPTVLLSPTPPHSFCFPLLFLISQTELTWLQQREHLACQEGLGCLHISLCRENHWVLLCLCVWEQSTCDMDGPQKLSFKGTAAPRSWLLLLIAAALLMAMNNDVGWSRAAKAEEKERPALPQPTQVFPATLTLHSIVLTVYNWNIRDNPMGTTQRIWHPVSHISTSILFQIQCNTAAQSKGQITAVAMAFSLPSVCSGLLSWLVTFFCFWPSQI